MSAIVADNEIFGAARRHLRGHVEQVGFFLADFEEPAARFHLREWRALGADAFEHQSAYHVTLRDEMRPEIIGWAADAGACLVEVHSHGEDGTPCFSPSDVFGFDEWVPHVRWRLKKRPYAAIVTAGERFDALAWTGAGADPGQLERLELPGWSCAASGLTLPRYEQLRMGRP